MPTGIWFLEWDSDHEHFYRLIIARFLFPLMLCRLCLAQAACCFEVQDCKRLVLKMQWNEAISCYFWLRFFRILFTFLFHFKAFFTWYLAVENISRILTTKQTIVLSSNNVRSQQSLKCWDIFLGTSNCGWFQCSIRKSVFWVL